MNTKDVVVYDGQCSFCRLQIKILKSLDFFNKFEFESFHDEYIRKKYNHISYEDFMKKMYIITKNKITYGGSEAVKYLSRKLILLWPISILLHIPYSSNFWSWIYGFIARNRYIIMGKCIDNCSIK